MKTGRTISIQTLFDNTLRYIINVLIVYIIGILAVGLGKTLYSMKFLLDAEAIGLSFSHVVADILSFLVMIELFRSFVEYFKAKRIRLHSMIDPAIIFIVRELVVKLYNHDALIEQTFIGFGVLLFSLGVIRTLAVLFSPKDETPG